MTRLILFISILFAGCKDSQQRKIDSPKNDPLNPSGKDSGYLINSRTIPPGNSEIFNFLESLKWKEDADSSGYDLKKTPNWNISLLIKNISDNGVLFIDPNDNFNSTISKKQVEKELSERKGKSYEMISHLTYIYSIPYRQYSELKFKENQGEKTTVNMGSWYELTFEPMNNRHYLIKCEFLQLEGE